MTRMSGKEPPSVMRALCGPVERTRGRISPLRGAAIAVERVRATEGVVTSCLSRAREYQILRTLRRIDGPSMGLSIRWLGVRVLVHVSG